MDLYIETKVIVSFIDFHRYSDEFQAILSATICQFVCFGSHCVRAQTHEHSITKRGGSKLVLNGIYLPIQLTDWLLAVVELPAHWLIHISLNKNRFGLFCLRKHLFMSSTPVQTGFCPKRYGSANERAAPLQLVANQ